MRCYGIGYMSQEQANYDNIWQQIFPFWHSECGMMNRSQGNEINEKTQIARFMRPTWVLSAQNGPHVGPMNLAIRETTVRLRFEKVSFLKSTQSSKYIRSKSQQLHILSLLQFITWFSWCYGLCYKGFPLCNFLRFCTDIEHISEYE